MPHFGRQPLAALAMSQLDLHAGARLYRLHLVQADRHATGGEVQRAARQRLAIRQMQHGAHVQRHAVRAADLALFAGGGDDRAKHDHVVDGPAQVQPDRIDLAAGLGHHHPHDAGDHAGQVQQQQQQVRAGDLRIEVAALDQAALGGDVELAQLGVDHRHQGRAQDVPGQRGLVHLVPQQMAMLALHTQVGQVGHHDVRQRVGEDHQRRGVDDMGAEEQEGQRRGQEDDPWQAIEEVQHRVGVAEPLHEAQALAEHRVVHPQDLRHATGPADALADVRREAFGGQASGLRHRDVGAAVAGTVQADGGMRILGHRLDRHTAHFLQRSTLDHGAGAAEEGRIPLVVAVLQQAVEQLAFVGHAAEVAQVAFERIGREEVVRGLHHRHLLVVQEPAHRHLQERAGRHVVAVEDRHVLATGLLQRRIDVAGLGVVVVGTGDVLHPDFFAERAELIAAAVIEQVDVELVGRPVQHGRGEHGGTHHRKRLVIGGDQYVHARPQRLVFGQRHRLAVQWPCHLEVAQHQHDEGVHLGGHQAQAQGKVDEAAHAHGVGQAPVHVARGHHQRQPHQHQRDQPVLAVAQAQGDQEHHGREQELLADLHRDGNHKGQQHGAADRQREQRQAGQNGIPSRGG